jgi:hypothetical protein
MKNQNVETSIVVTSEIEKVGQLSELLLTLDQNVVKDLLVELGYVKKEVEKVMKVSKSQLGRLILEECFSNGVQVIKREVILKRLEDECGMGHNYGGTFLTNYRKEKGYVS